MEQLVSASLAPATLSFCSCFGIFRWISFAAGRCHRHLWLYWPTLTGPQRIPEFGGPPLALGGLAARDGHAACASAEPRNDFRRPLVVGILAALQQGRSLLMHTVDGNAAHRAIRLSPSMISPPGRSCACSPKFSTRPASWRAGIDPMSAAYAKSSGQRPNFAFRRAAGGKPPQTRLRPLPKSGGHMIARSPHIRRRADRAALDSDYGSRGDPAATTSGAPPALVSRTTSTAPSGEDVEVANVEVRD